MIPPSALGSVLRKVHATEMAVVHSPNGTFLIALSLGCAEQLMRFAHPCRLLSRGPLRRGGVPSERVINTSSPEQGG